MARLTGNQLWKLRTTHGKSKLFSSGELLREEACRYFDWCDRHPWERIELVKYKGDSEEAEVPIGRPYTMDGLTVFLALSSSYFRTAKKQLRELIEAKGLLESKGTATPFDLAKLEESRDVLDAIEWIEQVVRTQQVEGAAVGVFNANLIARINLLADNSNVAGTMDSVVRVVVRDQETADNLQNLDDLL